MLLNYAIGPECEGKTVKHVLKNKLGLSERLIKKLKYSGKVFCNSVPVHVIAQVKSGDVISVSIDFDEENDNVIPEEIDLDIIYEDDCLIAVNKQADMVVHPTCNHPTGTVANGLIWHLNRQGVNKKIRPVSRLDRDTTGIIIFAKNEYVQEHLVRQMKNKTFLKEYIGVVHGIVENTRGTIDLPIERKPGSIMLRHISESGYAAITHYEVISYLTSATFLRFFLETGRTHQIRVHCQAIGHPLFGDTLYSDFNDSVLIKRQALHSYKASFLHPVTKNTIELSAPIPQDITQLLEILRK
ncbi:MAG TPA: RluA family pseudouridine synthase [Clostridiaceae bacterium]|nr:RluA family pseudouridine synthase [Clostridiaceae bacterium]